MATTATSPKIICRVKALYSFTSTEKSSLSFEKNDYIDVLSQLDSGWWDGWCKGNRGWFPSNYVKVVEVNPELIIEMRQDHKNVSRPRKNTTNSSAQSSTVSSYSSRQHDSEDDSEEEARTINLIRNMNNPTDLTKINSAKNTSSNSANKNSTTSSKPRQDTISPYTHPHSQIFHHQQQHQVSDEEQDLNLPDGWTLRIADDGVTKFYFNQKTGGLRWNHPGILDSDDDNYDSSDDESDMTLTNHSQIQEAQKIENLDDYNDFGAAKFKRNDQVSSKNLTADEPINLMSYWSKRTTPQGKVYYGNSVTHETTWNYDDIDPSTGRLKTSEAISDNNDSTENNESTSESSSNIDQPINWKSITTQIAQSVQDLNLAVSKDSQSDVLRAKIANVVDTVRHMLYSSRSMDRDAPHLQEADVKESLRVVLSTLAKLILSAKVIKESNTEINNKLQRDASEVLSAVRRFVLVCQSKNVGMEPINPKFIVFQSESDLADKIKNKRKSSTTTSNTSSLQKPKYPLNQDLLVSLQTHAKQIIGSTDALCKASSYIYSLEQKQQNNSETSSNEEEAHILNQRSRSNVILLFQNLSSQIGNYLAILSDIDISQIDLLQVQSLPEFRCYKQKLYNAIGLLFSAVQTITDTEFDLAESVKTVEELVKSIEDTIAKIASNVAQMVDERRAWLTKNGYNANMNDGGPWSPSHTYFESDNKKSGPNRGNILDEANELNIPEELNSPRVQRLYNRQNSGGQQQAQKPTSSTNASVATLSRPADKPLTRQYSVAQGNSTIPEEKTQFWFLRYDYADSDIEFTQEGGIKGGTLSALVERLTLHDYIDMSYIANFLLTYRSFCTTEDFVDLLQDRYNLAPPEGLTPDELEIWTDKKQKLVRLRVFNVMKNWLENYYNDEDEFILNKLQFFANTVIYDSSSFSAEQLNKLIRKRRELDANGGGLKKLIPNTAYGPTPIIPKNMQHIRLLETDPLELARQLTIMDFKLYSSIRPIECLGKAWSREGADNAVNVKQSIDYCNRLTSWVTGSILSNKEAKKRVVVIKYWSQVANRCLEMNNYNTCMAILSAFDNSAIGRLKKTWELVSSRTSQSLAQIRKLMGSNRNFTEYREMIHSVNPPCIPFLGIYLQDLTFIEDGNPDFLKTSNCLINFAKQQKSAEVIREIKQFQSPPYNFQFVPEIQDYIKNQLETSRDVDFLYERSLELEPRAPVINDGSG